MPDLHPTSDETLQRFERLQSGLPELWRSIEAGSGEHSSIVVPSLSFRPDEIEKIRGAAFYEERLLFTLMRLRDPRARVLYITSQPIHPHIVEYYLQLLVGVPASHARSRLQTLCVYDGSRRPLTEKILERPRFLERVRAWIGDPQRAYLTTFNATALERDLALALDVPLNGVDPRHLWMGTKSGSRQVFAAAGVDRAGGFEDVRDQVGVVEALSSLARNRPAIGRAVIKLNDSFAGAGNVLFRYPEHLPATEPARTAALAERLSDLQFTAAGETWPTFLRKLVAMGGVVEEMVEAAEVYSPSVQMRVTPLGQVAIVSTHDQILGGDSGQTYIGCRFPADARYRLLIQQEALKIGRLLAERGVVSRFAIDFLVLRDRAEDPWRAIAIEINLRMGGTTPPFLALQFLTGGEVDAASGEYRTQGGHRKAYYATDTLSAPSYRGLLPEDLIDILIRHDLRFRPSTETGVLFHMIGALSEHGKVGVTCIGDSSEEAETLFHRTEQVLDQETKRDAAAGRPVPTTQRISME